LSPNWRPRASTSTFQLCSCTKSATLLLKTDLDAHGLDQAISDLEALPFIVAPPATPLLKRAARVGKEFSLTFYDASFLALAVELDCPLITADRPFFNRTRSLPRVRHLSKVGSLGSYRSPG
jgi:predicted nucleic acid-binding protein